MPEAEDQIVRRILTAIDDDAGISQRKLSGEMGIAVGSVNWHLKRCVTKGLVKLQQAPVKRYLYYLTPKGFEEKARLTASFIQTSFELYRLGRKECASYFRSYAERGYERVFLAGAGDFAEIAIFSAMESPASPCVVIDGGDDRSACAGVPIVPSLETAITEMDDRLPDAVLLTDLADPRKTFETVLADAAKLGLGRDRIDVPRLLNFKPDQEL